MCIRDSYVYQIGGLCFFILESYVWSVSRYCFIRHYAATPVQLEVVVLQYIILLNRIRGSMLIYLASLQELGTGSHSTAMKLRSPQLVKRLFAPLIPRFTFILYQDSARTAQ
jgi:hypothetical protein